VSAEASGLESNSCQPINTMSILASLLECQTLCLLNGPALGPCRGAAVTLLDVLYGHKLGDRSATDILAV
jgi:hypothetical protein